MSNRIEILLDVDPNGRGASAIRNVGVNIDNLGRKTREAGNAGRDALDGFAGGLGVPTSIAAASSAIAAGILLVGNAARTASLEAAKATAILRADSQGAKQDFAAMRAEAKAFGDNLAVSGKEAEVSFARFLRVVTAAGEQSNLTKYRKQFEDLAAAYELTSTEVETLTSQLLSGQDEALNRLGIADPSQLYDRYAQRVGKVVENLTNEEKARARLLAVVEKGAEFEGAAARRLNEQTGQWALLSKTIADSTQALGDFLTKRTAVGEIPFLLTQGIKAGLSGGITGLITAYQAKLIAEAEARTKEAQAKANKDVTTFLNDQNSRIGTAAALSDPFGSFRNREILLGAEQAKKERENFVAQYDAIFKDKRLSTTTAIFAEEQFNNIRGIFDRDKREEIQAEFTKFWNSFAKTSINALKTAREAAESNFGRIAEFAAGENNPYAKVLLDANERAKELTDTFGILGDKVVSELLRAEDAYTKQKLLALDLDQTLKANALRREADALANFSGVSAAERRQLSVLDRQLDAANSMPELLAKAEAIANGIVKLQEGQFNEEGRRSNPNESLRFELGTSQDQVNRSIFDEILSLRRGEFGSGQRAEDRINQSLVDLFNGLAPEMQARIAQGLEGVFQQRTFAEAFRGSADAQRRAIEEEIAKARVADQAAQNVRDDIAAIEAARRQGLDTRAADARLLATSGVLSPDEMSADIRQARIEALRREADAESRERETANKALETATAATNNLTSSIDKLAGEIRDPKNRRLLVDINNRASANARAELYGDLR